MSCEQIRILQAESAPDSFDARFSRHLKCYVYSMTIAHGMLCGRGKGLECGRSWTIGGACDVKEMIAAAAYFAGEHDFSSFRSSDCGAESPVRTVLLSEISRPAPGRLLYTVQGRSFLKQMVRCIVGTLVEVGRGRLKAGDMQRIIEAKNRMCAGPTAPACGLCLEWVRYEETA